MRAKGIPPATDEEAIAESKAYLAGLSGGNGGGWKTTRQVVGTGMSQEQQSEAEIIVCSMADIRSKVTEWLWPGRFPKRALSLLVGDSGVNKSTMLDDVIARVTRGADWPDAEPGDVRAEPARVLMLSSEDDPEDTMRPRLLAAGADMKFIGLMEITKGADEKERQVNLKRDIDALRKLFTERRPALLVIDPVNQYLGDTESFKEPDVRQVLAPVSKLAQEFAVSVIGVIHLNKDTAKRAMDRVMGSRAFLAVARAVWLVAADGPTGNGRLFVRVKGNKKPRPGLAFQIESVTVTDDGVVCPDIPKVVWLPGEITMTADEALALSMPVPVKKPSAVDLAMTWLEERLADGGWVWVKDIYREGGQAGYSVSTLDRAKRNLGVEGEKPDLSTGWRWRLDPTAP